MADETSAHPTAGSLTAANAEVAEYGGRMAELARNLRSQRSSLLTVHHVVTATAEMVKNCADVSITVATADGRVETRASLGNGLAEQADQLQAQFREGPVIDAVWDSPLVVAHQLPDGGLWPRWGSAVVDQIGVHSVVCVQLFTHEDHELGALQLFATKPHAFAAGSVDEILGIAGQAAVALAAVANHEALQFGLVRRTAIGQATGILMERYELDQHAAFEVLRRTSQESGRKVYDLALELVGGGRPVGL